MATVIHEEITENIVCLICKRLLELSDEERICPFHGPIEPETRKTYRYQLADSTGIYPSVYYGEPPSESLLMNRIVVL